MFSEGIASPMCEEKPYFEVMRIPLLEGRDFDRNDDALHAPVMIVNQEFVRRFLGGQGAIGRKVHGWGRWFTIVGVARGTASTTA